MQYRVRLGNILWDTEQDDGVVAEQPPVYELGLRVEVDHVADAIDTAVDLASDMTGWLILECDAYYEKES